MTKKQHVDLHRKVALRRQLLRTLGDPAGSIYVPFCGDGDLAVELDYAKTFAQVLACDTNPERVATFVERHGGAAAWDKHAVDAWVDNADAAYPFDPTDVLAAGDFDAYVEPYTAFRHAWQTAAWAPRAALFFTDGHRQGIKRTGYWLDPDGNEHRDLPLTERRRLYHGLLARELLPWLARTVAPFAIVRHFAYLRMDMVYWGAVIESPDGAIKPPAA